MSDTKMPPLQVIEEVKRGAKSAKKAESIFDTIKANEIKNVRAPIDFMSEDAFKSDPQDATLSLAPLVIRDDPAFRVAIKYPKKPTEKDLLLIEYLEKYVGRIIYYYKNRFDLDNNITSPITFSCNFVPFSPVRKYTIPSGRPVAIPRWMIMFLRDRCKSFDCVFQSKDKSIIELEKTLSPIVELESMVIQEGPALIKILDLPRMPTALVG